MLASALLAIARVLKQWDTQTYFTFLLHITNQTLFQYSLCIYLDILSLIYVKGRNLRSVALLFLSSNMVLYTCAHSTWCCITHEVTSSSVHRIPNFHSLVPSTSPLYPREKKLQSAAGKRNSSYAH